MPQSPPDQPPSPEPKRNSAYNDNRAPKDGEEVSGKDTSGRDDGKPDEGTRPDQLTTENDDGQG